MSEAEDMPASELLDDSDRNRLLAAVPIPNTGPLDEDQRERVREAVKAHLEAHKIGRRAFAQSIGYGDESLWFKLLSNTYPHQTKIDEHLREMNSWIEQDARRRAMTPDRPFVETKVAKTMLDAATLAQRDPTIVLVIGPTGLGKTMAAGEIVRQHVGAMYLRLDRDCRTSRAICNRLCQALKIGRRRVTRGGVTLSRTEQIFDKLRNSNRLLVIDEAHAVAESGLQFLRDVYDITGIPMLLLCTKDLWTRIQSEDEDHGQVLSRIGLVVDLAEGYADPASGRRLYTKEDIRALYQTPKVRLHNDAVDYLCDVANTLGRGSLRRCDELMRRTVQRARKLSGVGPDGEVTITGHLLAQTERATMRERVAACEVQERRARVAVAVG